MIPSRTRLSTCLLLGIIILLSGFTLAACGDNPTTTPATKTTPAAANNPTSKVAILMAGSVSDGGWYALGLEAALQMRKELGLTVDYFENISPEKEVTTMRDLASKGYGLIMLHGSTVIGDNVKQVAPEFPNTWFVEFDGKLTTPNSVVLTLKYEEVGYLAGMTAAYATKADKVGAILGPEAPTENRYTQSLINGVKAVKPKAEVMVAHLDWEDSTGATAAAKDFFDKGAEVIIYDLNPSDQPVLKVAKERGKLVINANYDLNSIAPDTALTSTLYSMPTAYSVVGKLWKEKKLENKIYSLGLKEYALLLAPLRGKISKEAEAQIEQAKADIIAGKLNPVPTTAS